jgi:acyl dehydratase
MSATSEQQRAPYFDDLRVGDRFTGAPALTLTSGHAAMHQAVLGDRLRLPLDARLCRLVTGSSAALAHPGLVCDVAIGQSTVVTPRVVANLFYRGLVLMRAPRIGDTLSTEVEVVALRRNSARPGRAATGLAVLRVRTRDQLERPVLDFWRCAMLPLGDPDGSTEMNDDVEAIGAEVDPGAVAAAVEGWRLDAFREAVPGPHFEDLPAEARWQVEGGDVVSAAPELARLTLNVAMAHRDRRSTASGRRLVYGGHTIGIASSQVSAVLPNLVTVVAWHSCDHLGPVHEEDTLHTELELERRRPLPGGGGLVDLRARVGCRRQDGSEAEVLDWRFVAVMA